MGDLNWHSWPNKLCDVDFGPSLAVVTVVSAAIDGTTEFDWSEHLASLHAALVSSRESVNSVLVWRKVTPDIKSVSWGSTVCY